LMTSSLLLPSADTNNLLLGSKPKLCWLSVKWRSDVLR
jgi:hypothetical protein